MRRLIDADRPLAILLIVFAALALVYSLIIPLFEGPDEDDHFRYARFLADRRALPVQAFVAGGGEAGHQGWQPPLYYTLAALVLAPLDTSDFESHLWRNPAGTFLGDPACCGRNIYFHTDVENFPFTGTTLAVHLARLLAVISGAVTVWATYQIARALAPGSLVPLAAAAVVAFNPSFLFASALVSNDGLLAALSALVVLLWAKLITGTVSLSSRYALALGVVLGLALLTKTTALGLVAFSVLVLVLVAWRTGNLRAGMAAVGLTLGVAAVLAGWWFVRNQVLYGDPLAYGLMTASAIFPRSGPLTLPEFFQISLPWLWQTFWGGPTPGDFSPALLAVLAALAGIAALGMLPVLLKSSNPLRLAILTLAAWLGFIFVAQIQFIRTTVGADQGRYLFPAITIFAVFFAAGLGQVSTLLARRVQRIALAGVVAGSLGLALWVPLAYTLPAYARPALLGPADTARITHPVQATFADKFQLLGYDLDTRAVKPGETLEMSLYWRALAPMSESYRVFVHLIGQDNRSAGGVDVIPARGAFPTVYWRAGDTIRDTVRVLVLPNAGPGKYSVEIGVYPAGSPGERLTVTQSGDDRVVVDAIKVAPFTAAAYVPQVRLGAAFDGRATLVGYDARADGKTLFLSLDWQSTARFERDYTVFVHVLDRDGKIVAQADREPQAGNYPTSMWTPGEQVRDEYTFFDVLAPYRVEVGLYRQDTGERLPAQGNGSAGDHVEFRLPGVVP